MAARDKTAHGRGRGAAARVLRIIGGQWRGRKLRFPADADIRPTPDRVRETLFNWLTAQLPGARCLDLFAGSGALGLEALSRGAAGVTFVDRDAAAIREIRARLTEWQGSGAQLVEADALGFLKGSASPYQVVFLDPPYASDLLPACARELVARGWLAPGARIYVECAARAGPPALPEGLELLRSKRAGEVGYHLYGYPAAAAAP
ncbi:MAG: 16S rRNA (guanine(966)-N(2))-methyltransferase RsmD [Proteobacteria bacterium]|nr:16S rRNA (guanine(966)-N(2))-methyltransferase RsmD [Pseudomonadota bacterium]